MNKLKKYFFTYGILTFVLVCLIGIAYAAFSDKGKVLGSSFSVGNADMKLLINPALGIDSANLADEMPGPSFTNIGQNWQQDYPVKLYNNGTYQMALTSHSDYLTINDPDDLRTYIYAEIFPWDDTNNNGVIDENELQTSLGRKTITKWKTEGFALGSFNPGEVKGINIRFSTDTVSDTKQAKNAIFDFVFDSIEL